MKSLRLAALAAFVAAGLAPGAALAARTDITVGMVLEPTGLDPTSGNAAATDEVTYANIFEGLTRIDETGAVQPDLAKSWDIAKDGLTYTFHLQDGVRFHDGTPLTADVVKFSLDRTTAEGSTNGQKQLFAAIDTVEAVDPLTVKVTLKHPQGNLLYNLAWGDAEIVAPSSAATNATNPVGTGPFKFVGWVKGDRVDLEKNPDYWGTPARLDKATFKFISDPTAAFAALMAGDVDAFPNFPAPETLAQFKSDPRFSVTIGTTEGETILAMNNGKKPFDDLKVRQAMSYAIDRKAIVDGAMFGYGTPIGSHYSPADPGYVDFTGVYAYNPDKAKALLREAGYPDGFKVTLKLPPPSYARRGGEIIAQQLKAVGVDAEIIPVEWAQWLSDVFKNRNYDLTIVSHTEPADYATYARDDYYFDYHSDAVKALMDKLNLATDAETRNALIGDIQKKIADDAVNVFLFELAKTGVWNAKIKGLWANSPIQANDLTGVSWED
jgi:peptide/nickel transport system substrate-binding protein